MSHTQTVAKVAIEEMTRKTSPGMTTFISTPDSSAPIMTRVVTHGTPLRVRRSMTAGPCRRWARPNMVRPAAKMSLLIADSAAVRATRLSTAAADLSPTPAKISTKGLPEESMACQGVIDMITARVRT